MTKFNLTIMIFIIVTDFLIRNLVFFNYTGNYLNYFADYVEFFSSIVIFFIVSIINYMSNSRLNFIISFIWWFLFLFIVDVILWDHDSYIYYFYFTTVFNFIFLLFYILYNAKKNVAGN